MVFLAKPAQNTAVLYRIFVDHSILGIQLMRTFHTGCLGLVLLLTFLVAGCSSQPSDSDVKEGIESMIQKNSNGLIKLIDFRQTGITDVGYHAYRILWNGYFEFPADCIWSLEDFEASVPDVTNPNTWNAEWTSGANVYDRNSNTLKLVGRKNQPLRMNGMSIFEKTGKGWQMRAVAQKSR